MIPDTYEGKACKHGVLTRLKSSRQSTCYQCSRDRYLSYKKGGLWQSKSDRNSERHAPSMVYVLVEPDGFKIGVGRGTGKAVLAQVRRGNPRDVQIYAYYPVESKRRAHELEKKALRAFDEHNLVRDWFHGMCHTDAFNTIVALA